MSAGTPKPGSTDPQPPKPLVLPDINPFEVPPFIIPATSGLTASSRRSSYGAGGGKQITRNRASYSCHTCRRRKVKCDKVHPICGNCIKSGSHCVYDPFPKNDNSQRGSVDNSSHGSKRRRKPSRPPEDEAEQSTRCTEDAQETVASHNAPHDPKPGTPAANQAIEARLDRLTSMIERLSRTNGPQSLDAVHDAIRARDAESQAGDQKPSTLDLQNAAESGSTRLETSQSRPTSPKRHLEAGVDDFPIPGGLATDLVDPVGSLNVGHLSLEDGKSRYVGTTYWAYISDEINELNQLLRDQNRSHQLESDSDDDSPRTFGDNSPEDGSFARSRRNRGSFRGSDFHRSVLFPSGDSPSANEKIVDPDMLDHVPSKRQSHLLYKGFMSGVHAISPVIHPPTVLVMYNAFWEWYDHSSYSGAPCPNPSFLPLLYAIWYGGSVTISIRTVKAEFNMDSRAALSARYHDEVTRWLTNIAFPKSPSMHGLAAFLLVQTILSKEEEPLTSSLFISLALRVAQTMGLHRDPSQFGIPPCEAESRRRMWWHIVHMDGVVAMSSGLPPLVSDEIYWDVRPISEVKDTFLGTAEAAEYERAVREKKREPDNPDEATVCGGPSMVNVYYISARGKYIMARATRKILRIQLGTKPVTRKDMEDLRLILSDLETRLRKLVNRIPVRPGARSADNQGTTSPTEGFHYYKMLEDALTPEDVDDGRLPEAATNGCVEQYHSPVLIAFHKWARILLSLFIDKAFCVAYQPFLKNAKSKIWPVARQRALRHCHGFMEKFILLATDPDFQPFQWSWPGNHQPMHATMIMLIDLYERPDSPEASKSRAFIDKIFSLSGPDGGVVGGEDGITTQRPLKDGGREAWDMLRRLREKAWQKAGLDPDQLWTEQAQYQAGVAMPYLRRASLTESPAQSDGYTSHRPSFAERYYSLVKGGQDDIVRSEVYDSGRNNAPVKVGRSPPNGTSSRGKQSQRSDQAEADSSLGNIQIWPQPVSQAAPFTPIATGAPQFPMSQDVFNPNLDSTLTASAATPATTNDQPALPFDGSHLGRPSSVLDPSLHFDWDQWDAVFGQHLPVVDEFSDPTISSTHPDLGTSNWDDFG